MRVPHHLGSGIREHWSSILGTLRDLAWLLSQQGYASFTSFMPDYLQRQECTMLCAPSMRFIGTMLSLYRIRLGSGAEQMRGPGTVRRAGLCERKSFLGLASG